MSAADLYIRVSTDEQADKGYSQRNQEEMLRRYCEQHAIEVREVIREDHSAKTFNRPAWKSYLLRLKKKRWQDGQLVLFTKWDRFSRNAGDAYQMISLLRSFGVEPQAIDQPLDLAIPENKMMLAFYLAAPEVENDRRALNVLQGMRRARKEGRWVSSAPIGYANLSAADGRKYIAAKYPAADIIRWVFEEIRKQEFHTEQVWKIAVKKGLKTGRNNFYKLIRNPIYCGKIIVPALKDEPAYWAEGQHEGLISETLFKDVQLILSGRRKKKRQFFVPGQLPLRGFIRCSCDRVLSGSASKGRNAYYYYYHGFRSCPCRYKAEEVHSAFIALLNQFKAQAKFGSVFRAVVKERLAVKQGISASQRETLVQKIKSLQERIHQARDLMLSGDLEPVDYQQIKIEGEAQLGSMQSTLDELPDLDLQLDDIFSQPKNTLPELSRAFKLADTEHKRKLTGMLFPGKLTYTGRAVFYDRTFWVLEKVYVASAI
ncbi:DNA invertase Pin-like site-specific DNA recombinase [Mucilaginibacter gracilis]|uniref:DNA invertase Pin-like site-specific DNA recombinase n=1 Tax=Mucilaginibacter gracilis TaxID=423350 RepID=A0A495IYV9_9SPHI|nr:recombinase family protein [Mucilaginibacter gracilis]RKR81895.1 DNA invertase Pin-like site-specific DNA recombinase [Mucilaginibacter gracilis]